MSTNERRRERYQTDPEYRERKKAVWKRASRKWYYAHLPAARAAARERMANLPQSPERRARHRVLAAAHYLKVRDDPTDIEARAEARRRRGPQPPTDADRERWRRNAPDVAERLRRQQEFTKQRAASNRHAWTPEQDREVMRTDLTVLELALRLGRTRASVVTRRHALRKEGPQ